MENVPRPVAVVIAPYAPDAVPWALGAGQKIRLVVEALLELGYDVHLVDSSHQVCGRFPAQRRAQLALKGGTVLLWRPRRYRWRPLGKLMNYLWLHAFDRQLAALEPTVVWVYNSYAYEARLALAVAARSRARLVFELEDLPESRPRGFSPKPWLDARYFQPLLRGASAVTFVNDALLQRFRGSVRRSLLLPSILDEDMRSLSTRRRFETQVITVGYFGGLEVEKGADRILAAVEHLPSQTRLVITGSGTLASQFAEVASRYPEALSFHGTVSRSRLVELMASCDVILNPHTAIDAMENGVFPFKVIEGVASGALLVSTPLPPVTVDLNSAIRIYDGTLEGLINAIATSRDHYASRFDDRVATIHALWERYSHSAFRESIRDVISP